MVSGNPNPSRLRERRRAVRIPRRSSREVGVNWDVAEKNRTGTPKQFIEHKGRGCRRRYAHFLFLRDMAMVNLLKNTQSPHKPSVCLPKPKGGISTMKVDVFMVLGVKSGKSPAYFSHSCWSTMNENHDSINIHHPTCSNFRGTSKKVV